MFGETNLQRLLANMQSELIEGEYVFCSIPLQAYDRLRIQPIGRFREAKGITIVVERKFADDEDLDYTFISRMITLNVHSSLEAVGLITAITSKLTAAGISANTISAYYHDHLFVPTDRADVAMKLLDELRDSAQTNGGTS